jgi:hypothetical protein
MKKVPVAGFGLLVLISSMVGCTQGASTAPAVSLQQECERSGGLWRSGARQREGGGGGY